MDSELRKLQLAELDVLKRVIAICDAHNLKYYAVGGTLIGAVRHKGFIPWDDDIDIAMPRPDYNCFLKIASLELDPPYLLNTIDTNNNGFCYYYARAENTSILLERNATRMKKIVPVWIDIFPLDGAPDSKREMRTWRKKGAIRKKLFALSQYSYLASDRSSSSSLNNLIYKCKLDKLISTKLAWKLLNRTITKYDYGTSETIVNYCGRYGDKEVTPKAIFGGGCMLEFEDIQINCPSEFHLYLTQIYGDYMKLPPENERLQHNIKILPIEATNEENKYVSIPK